MSEESDRLRVCLDTDGQHFEHYCELVMRLKKPWTNKVINFVYC